MRYERTFLALLFVITMIFSSCLSESSAVEIYPRTPDVPVTGHAPILITGDLDFSLQGFPGNGSLSDPYRIEQYEIYATSGGHCISISGVSVYYEISDCVLHGSTDVSTAAIYLESGMGNVSRCDISNSSIGIEIDDTNPSNMKYIHNTTISDFTEFGVLSSNGNNIALRNVKVLNDGGVPIKIVESNNVSFTECTITNNTATTGYGIFISDSDNIEILNCTFYGASHVHFEENVSNITISESMFIDSQISVTSKNNRGIINISRNTLTFNLDWVWSWGILIGDNESSAVVQENTIEGYRTGIQFQDNSDTITQNYITRCETGILVSGNNNTVQNNTLNANDVGIKVLFGSNNSLFYNWFLENGISASDSGSDNVWDDNSGLGNYYDDFPPSQIGVYNITGSAESIDRWPVYIGDVIPTSTITTTDTSSTTTTSSSTINTNTDILDTSFIVMASIVSVGIVVVIVIMVFKKRS